MEIEVINKYSIIKQGSILAAASIIVRIIGLLYRIPMANIIGEKAMGIYSAAFEVYNILLILSSYSMPMAVSKLVSIKFNKNEYKNGYLYFCYSMIFSCALGGLASVSLFSNASWIEKNFLNNYSGISISLKILAPTILIVSIMGVLRGFFQGSGNMIPTAISQIFEQVINALVSVGAAIYLVELYSEINEISAWGAAGGTLGTCIGATCGLLIVLFIMFKNFPQFYLKVKLDTQKPEKVINSYIIIIMTIIPIILSQTIYQISGVIDITLFNNILGRKAILGIQISTMQGSYSTLYKILISVPIAISTAFASSIIPSIAASYANKKMDELRVKVDKAILFNMNISIPSTLGLMAFGSPILQLLFPSYDIDLGKNMLLLGSCAVMFYSYSTTTSTVLQGINKMKIPVLNSLIALIIHVFIIYSCLQFTNMNVYALVIGNIVFPIIVMLLNTIYLRKYLKYNCRVKKMFVIPLLSATTMAFLGRMIYYILMQLTKRNSISLIVSIFISIVIYFFMVIKLQGIREEEILEFPGGATLKKMFNSIHLKIQN